MTGKLLLPLVLLMAWVLSSGKSQAQTAENWKLLSSTKGVSVYYEPGTCLGKDVLFLKIENAKDRDVTIDWSLWEGQDGKTLLLKANETITGACVNRLPENSLIEFIPAGKTVNEVRPIVKVTKK